MLHASDIDAFVDELENEIRAKELSILDCEFLAAVESDAITRRQVGEWAKAFYAATRNGRLLLGNFYANSPDDPELRRELAENLYEEETGRISGVGRCHMEVFDDSARAPPTCGSRARPRDVRAPASKSAFRSDQYQRRRPATTSRSPRSAQLARTRIMPDREWLWRTPERQLWACARRPAMHG